MCSIEQEKNSYIFCGEKKNHQIWEEKCWAQHLGASRLQLVREICD